MKVVSRRSAPARTEPQVVATVGSDIMPRATRVLVELSLAACVAAYLAASAVDDPLAARLGGGAALAALVAARVSARWTGRVLLPLAALAPALLALALGGTSIHHHSLWLAAAAGWLIGESPLAGWSLPRPWRTVLVAWALVVAVCWPIVYLREIDFLYVSDILSYPAGNGLAPGAVWRWAHGVSVAGMSLLVGVLWCDRLFARYGERPRPAPIVADVVLPLGVGFAITCLVALYQSWVDPSWLTYGVWIAARRAPGTVLDANGLGVLVAIESVVLAGFLRAAPDAAVTGSGRSGSSSWPVSLRGFPAAGVLVVGCLAVFASGSRTGFVAFVVGAVAIVVAATTSRQRLWLAGGTLALLGLLMVGARLGVLRTATPVQRLAATLPEPSAAGVASLVRALWTRDGWGLAAVVAIRRHPLTGVGIGTFARQSVDYYYYTTGKLFFPDNAQNWWRQQVAEFGVAGWLFAGALTFLVGRLCLRRTPPGRSRAIGASLRGALAGLALASLFGVPTQVPAVALAAWTFIFLAIRHAAPANEAASDEGGRERGPLSRLRPGMSAARSVLLVLLVAATAGGQLYAGTHALRAPMRSAEAGVQFAYGFWRGGVGADGRPFWWADRHAVFVFPTEGGVLEFVATPMHPDIAVSPVHVRIWLEGQLVVDRLARDHAPIPVRVATRQGQRGFFIETRVDRTFPGRRGEPQGLMIQKNVFMPAS
jgi:hypothetical protein